MKVLLLLANGFETMEFSPFVDVFGWAKNDYGIDITVVTCGLTKKVLSAFSVPVIVDKTIEEISAQDYDALAVPGGFEEYGFYRDAFDDKFLELIRDFERHNKIIASVCVGALPLAKSGVLTGRRATTYHLKDGLRQKQLLDLGAKVVNQPIVVDENIITSYCPQTAPGVAFELLKALTSVDQTEKIIKDMGFDHKL